MATILTVDDSRLSRRRFVAAPLKNAGYNVVEAENGKQGLEAVEQHHPDCIVTDLLMPEMDGFEFIEHLRQLGESTPIIVASADIQASSRQRIDELETFAFLNKPFSPEQLLEVVSEALKTLPTEE